MIFVTDSQSSSSDPIVVVSQMGRYGETGVQTHINEFLQYMKEQRREAQFVGPDESVNRLLVPHFQSRVLARLISLHSQIARYLFYRMAFHATRAELGRRLRGHSSWVVYAQDPTSANAALLLKKGARQRVVLAVHFNVSQADEMANRGVLKYGDWLYRRTQRREREALANVDEVVFFSYFMQQEILRQGVNPRSKIVIPHTVSKPMPDLKAEPRDLIAIGSLEPRKNQTYLLHVLYEAALRGHLYTLTLVGSGEDRGRLEEQARHLGVDGQVSFTGRHPNASSLLGAHKVLVHSAKMETFGIALVEALAAGKPILAPQVGGIPEVFTDGVEGFFWPLEDPAVGASILIRLMEDESLRASMSSAATLRYRTHFEHDLICQKLVSYVCKMESMSLNAK
jgi:glycosyltransferase involved in cell wall biosynthesis